MFLVEKEPSHIIISARKSFFAEPVILIEFKCSKAVLNELPSISEMMMRVDEMRTRCFVFFNVTPYVMCDKYTTQKISICSPLILTPYIFTRVKG